MSTRFASCIHYQIEAKSLLDHVIFYRIFTEPSLRSRTIWSVIWDCSKRFARLKTRLFNTFNFPLNSVENILHGYFQFSNMLYLTTVTKILFPCLGMQQILSRLRHLPSAAVAVAAVARTRPIFPPFSAGSSQQLPSGSKIRSRPGTCSSPTRRSTLPTRTSPWQLRCGCLRSGLLQQLQPIQNDSLKAGNGKLPWIA